MSRPVFGKPETGKMSFWDKPDVRAEIGKQRGMEASYSSTTTRWKEEAGVTLNNLIQVKDTITSEDIIISLEKRGITTGNNKAMGALMTAAQRSGLIQPLPEYKQSALPRRHKAPIRVWKVVK